MLFASVLVFLLTAVGVLVMAYRYITATPPLDYHGDILSGTAMTDETLTILGALYKVMGGAFAALGAGLILLTVFGVWADLFWPKLTILLMTGIAGWFATTVPRRVEARTGVRTPWRITAGLVALSALGFVLSLF